MKNILLLATTFIAGASIMVVEMLGSRILAPYYGSSVYVWAILIGVVLTSLSVGYYIGGKYADRNPSYASVVKILMASALFVVVIAAIKDVLLTLTSFSALPLYFQAAIDAIVLFVPSTLLLAMVSPLLSKLALHKVDHAGTDLGLLYTCSTVGSIVGTFLGGVVLISYVSVTVILIGVSCTLLANAIIIALLKKQRIFTLYKTCIVSLIIICSIFSLNSKGLAFLYDGLVADVEGVYGRLWVFDKMIGDATAVRYITNTVSAYQSGMFVESPSILLFPYTAYLDVYTFFNPKASKVLLIGGGAYSYPKYVAQNHPTIQLDVVDIDPEMRKIAKDYFGFKEHPTIKSYTEDGRVFLQKATTTYDAILLDAFSSSLVAPFHLTTKEFITKVYDSLSPEGIVIVNLISSNESEKSTFLGAQYKTYASLFDHVAVINVSPRPHASGSQNFILIASKKEINMAAPAFTKLLERYSSRIETNITTSNVTVLTDEFSPIEKYVY